MSSFNVGVYGDKIRETIPDISPDDLIFISNRAANVYRTSKEERPKNFRVSRIIDGHHSDSYEEAVGKSQYGSIDKVIVNSKTGNSFTIGFDLKQ